MMPPGTMAHTTSLAELARRPPVRVHVTGANDAGVEIAEVEEDALIIL